MANDVRFTFNVSITIHTVHNLYSKANRIDYTKFDAWFKVETPYYDNDPIMTTIISPQSG